MRVCEFIISIKSEITYKEIAIPLVEKIITNYNKFKIAIKDNNERRVCDDYIRSMKNLVKIMKEKVRFYEEYQREKS